MSLRKSRSSASLIISAGLCGGLSMLSACGAGRVGEAVRPEAPSGAAALGEVNVQACKAGISEPLVVDLKSNERSDLEVAMKDGVAVVAYDCRSLRILKGCSTKGAYRFAGVTRKEDVVRMTNQDEVAANMPLSGASISSQMKRGSTIDLALVTVGKSRATANEVTRADLEGSCDGATHVVRGTYVGAFAMSTGAEGEVRAAAQIFGAGAQASSAAGKHAEARDGSLEACRKATADASAAPSECAAVTRLELLPLVEKKRAPDARPPEGPPAPAEVACPSGSTWNGVKCAYGATTKGACARTGTADECGAACEGGSGESCFNLAVYAQGGTKTPDGVMLPSPRPDLALLEKACELGHAEACSWAANRGAALAHARETKEADRKGLMEKAARLETAACDLGLSYSCLALSDAYDPNRPETFGIAKSVDRSVAYVKRACDLGLGMACGRLGDLHRDGKMAKQDGGLAIAAYERQCAAGGYTDGDGCYKIGAMYENGVGVRQDHGRALDYLSRACNLRRAVACSQGAKVADEQKDAAQARSFLERGCTADLRGWDACLALGDAYREGQYGLQKDFGKAAEAYERGCARGACAKAGALYKSGGPGLPANADKALDAFAKGCTTWADATACAGQEALLKPKGKAELAKFYERRCSIDARACLKWKAFGGAPDENVMKFHVELAQRDCQKHHYGDACKLWKELGGKPSAAELAQPPRPAPGASDAKAGAKKR